MAEARTSTPKNVLMEVNLFESAPTHRTPLTRAKDGTSIISIKQPERREAYAHEFFDWSLDIVGRSDCITRGSAPLPFHDRNQGRRSIDLGYGQSGRVQPVCS